MEKVLVVGAARSGSAVSKLLAKKGYEVYLTDQKAIVNKAELEKAGIKVFDNGHPDSLKELEYKFVVKNPGIPYHAPFIKYFVEKNAEIFTEVEVASWYPKEFIYAGVTGTNGKTTITSILYALLQYNGHAEVAGNIGFPLSEIVLKHENEKKDIAIELSNFQLLGTKSFHPHVSVVCNLSPDHLDYMDSLEAYYESKMKIYESCDKNDYFLRNVDDEEVMKYAKNIPCQVIDFSLIRHDVDLCIKEGTVYFKGDKLFDINILKIVGMHNVSNAMVAASMAYLMGVSKKNIVDGLSKFESVEHRLEYVGKRHGVNFYNDSKATNPEAVEPALKAFDGNIILLAGGYDKKLPFDVLKKYDGRIKQCYAFGETRHAFNDIFSHVEECEDMQEAFNKAVKIAKPGDTVLLSPACASFDQFPNYEIRGERFKDIVKAYLQEDD